MPRSRISQYALSRRHPESVSRMSVMKSPSTVHENGQSTIMPLRKIQTTPTNGTRPSTRESTRIIGRKLPPLLLFRFFLFQGSCRFPLFTPKLMPGAVNEYIFESRLAHGNRLNLAGKSFDQVGNEAMAFVTLNAQLATHDDRCHTKTLADVLSQQSGVNRGVEQDYIAANFALQFSGRSECDQISFVHDGQLVAALGFFHEVGCDEY